MSHLTFTAAGDCIITRRLLCSKNPQFVRLVKMIKEADVAFANLEVVTPVPPLIPSSEYGGWHLSAPEFVLDELKHIGFNLFNLANNHAIDYTFLGLLDTMEALESRDMVYAGAGRNLGEARSPVYLETSAGRVGLIAATSSFPTGAHAGAVRPDMPGRPGINPLRYKCEYVLDKNRMAALKDIDEALGTAAVTERQRRYLRLPGWRGFRDNARRFLGQDFVLGEKPGIRQWIKKKDLEEVCRWITDARRQADFVVASVHSHQGPLMEGNIKETPDSLVEACHLFVKAGAAAVVCHGPHVLRGLEIYQGKPIFYSLGNFIFQIGGTRRFPSEMYEQYGLSDDATPADIFNAADRDKDGIPHGFLAGASFWQSVLPICRYDQGHLLELKLYPVTLHQDAPRSRRGDPSLAEGDLGHQILDSFAKLCKPYSIKLEIKQDDDLCYGEVK